MGFFRKKYEPDRTDIVYEKWNTSFSRFQQQRFISDDGDGYSSEVERGAFKLHVKRQNLFAWADDLYYRYENFLLTAELGISKGNGYSAAGFLFRRIDDTTYYYFLVSNHGYYRLDSVINGTPSVLIDWTKCPDFNTHKFSVSILADGERVNLFLDGKWIGAASDEGIDAGGISFAGQNYGEADNAVFYLNRLEIESRPSELSNIQDKLFSESITVDARLNFASGQMRINRHGSALIELKRALNTEPGNPEILLMTADCCLSLEMYSEALNYLEKVPEAERGERYYMCRAGALYLGNNFIELRNMLTEHETVLSANPAAFNLLGNAEFSLGNWGKAAAAYSRAFEQEPSQALFALNAARAWEKAEDTAKALKMYNEAAAVFFRAGNYDELQGIMPFLKKLDRNSNEIEIIRSKLLFQEEQFEEADKIFKKLIRKKVSDSTVYYLKALIEARAGRSVKADNLFKKAVEIEPDYYLYHFKRAENLYMSGRKYEAPLNRALELAPEDPWVLNLAGLAAMEKEKSAGAAEYFQTAVGYAPEETDILINYSDALFHSGQTKKSLDVISSDNPALLNQRGNIYSRIGDFKKAAEDYEAALIFDRGNVDIMLNLAAACIESDSYSRAEELLVKVLDSGHYPEAFNMMGNLALLKGEYSRAEVSYQHALEANPGFQDAACNLAELYISRDRLNDADRVLGAVKGEEYGERLNKLKKTLFRERMTTYKCSACGEEWVVPKKISQQGGLKLVGEPPDSMPAGKCGECGKIFCIGCGKKHLADGRFTCEHCGGSLKLNEDWMRYLYHANILDK